MVRRSLTIGGGVWEPPGRNSRGHQPLPPFWASPWRGDWAWSCPLCTQHLVGPWNGGGSKNLLLKVREAGGAPEEGRHGALICHLISPRLLESRPGHVSMVASGRCQLHYHHPPAARAQPAAAVSTSTRTSKNLKESDNGADSEMQATRGGAGRL